MGDTVDHKEIQEAFRRLPTATILVFPRADGRYPADSTDVVGLLHEAGLSVEYATDPVTAGTFTYKSVEVVLPAVIVALAQLGDVATLIGALTSVVRHFLGAVPGRNHVTIDVGFEDGNETRWAKIDVQGDPARAEGIVADTLARVLGERETK